MEQHWNIHEGLKKKHQTTSSFFYTCKGVKIAHDFDDYGNHRLRKPTGRPGPWVSYQMVAKLGSFYATADYYKDVLPTVFYAEKGVMK